MNKLNCLHICNDFLGSKVHQNLYNLFAEKDFKQTIFYPAREIGLDNLNPFPPSYEIKVISSKPLKKYHKYLFKSKIKYLFKDLNRRVNLEEFQIIHATTLLVDGALAYQVFKKYKTPFIVSVRGTDLNTYLRYRKDLFPLVKEILLAASKIIFISNSLESNFYKYSYIKKLKPKIGDKCEIIYNGIDSIWLNNINKKKAINPFKLLYIGRFDKNKNVLNLVKGVLQLKKSGVKIEIELIGKKGEDESIIKILAEKHPDVIKFNGPIFDKNKLLKKYTQNHIFVMPSYSETFGLVYIEALSQGLPVLYSNGQGIDGLFKCKVGEGVNPRSKKDIKTGIKKILDNYKDYATDEIDFSIFKWEYALMKYLKIYNSIVK